MRSMKWKSYENKFPHPPIVVRTVSPYKLSMVKYPNLLSKLLCPFETQLKLRPE